MRKSAGMFIVLAAVLANTAWARDTRHHFPIQEALSSPAAQNKMDKDIRLYFGEQKHPQVLKTLGSWTTNKKTNAFNKSDKEACDWTFLSAVLELQERAVKEGGDAVINIRSVYKGENEVSETEYLCGAGALMSGVALNGTVVKFAK